MNEFILPQGDRAALMPGAAYSVPGLFLYSDLFTNAWIRSRRSLATPFLCGISTVRLRSDGTVAV